MMTPSKKISDALKILRQDLHSETYLKINFALAGVILLIMIYSGIFSPEKNNYPLVCVHEKIKGEQCVSCGISHSFSLIIRGRLDEAYNWNPYGFRVFLFFFSQLLMRITFSMIYSLNPGIRKQLILYDIICSAAIFLISFYPFIRQILSDIIGL